MKYEDAFLRNIGLFSNAEQDRLRNATVFITGVGGVGGIQAAIRHMIHGPGIFNAQRSRHSFTMHDEIS